MAAKKKAAKKATRCTCRAAKRHDDCAYCGYGGDGSHICGQCKNAGIDGPVIRGTEQRRCEKHNRRWLT